MKLTCGENLKLLKDSIRFSNSLVAEDFFDVCFVEEDLSDRNLLGRAFLFVGFLYFFLEFDLIVSVVSFKLSIKSSIDLAFFWEDSSAPLIDLVGVEFAVRAV